MPGKTLKIILIALAIGGLGLLLAGRLLPQKTAGAVDGPAASGQTADSVPLSPGSGAAVSPLSATNTLPLSTSLVFGGDVMLSRVVGQKMAKYKDFAWPFQKLKDLLSQADLAVINLESPFTLDSKSYVVPTGSFSFNADPRALAGLEAAGVDLVALANNHFANQGQKGMRDTFKLLEQKNIAYAGAGADLTAAHAGTILDKNGIRFGFLDYGYPVDSSNAGTDRPGIANMDLASARTDVQRMKGQADLVIVLIHDGVEYTNLPTSHQKEFARAMIDAGADLIVGHHPHWVQQVEIYENKPIIYSLGNLVFDQMWSQETREGALVKVELSGRNIRQLEFIPIIINDYGQPWLVTDLAQKKRILQRMGLENEVIDLEN